LFQPLLALLARQGEDGGDLAGGVGGLEDARDGGFVFGGTERDAEEFGQVKGALMSVIWIG
jgi:hypothetical protein